MRNAEATEKEFIQVPKIKVRPEPARPKRMGPDSNIGEVFFSAFSARAAVRKKSKEGSKK